MTMVLKCNFVKTRKDALIKEKEKRNPVTLEIVRGCIKHYYFRDPLETFSVFLISQLFNSNSGGH